MSLSVDLEKTLGAFHLRLRLEAENEVLALLGASGSGKSVTLKCIAGLIRPDRGRIILNGRILFDSKKGIDLPPQERRVGYLFQQYALFPNMTVAQNIACGARKTPQSAGRVAEMLRTMRLEGLEKRYPHTLSGGQQQRVALARILVSEPEALLLDEPFSALDSHLRFQLEQELRAVLRDFQKPVVLVSHDRDEVFRLSHSLAVLQNGSAQTQGTKDAVFRDPKTVAAARLTGCKNISPIHSDGNGVFADNWNLHLRVRFDPSTATHIGVRMHDLRLGKGENAVSCTVCEEIENPFSYTVMLLPDDAKEPLGIELEKPVWEHTRAERVEISLPMDALLPLRA